MTVTEEEKEALRILKKSEGWKVLLRLEDELLLSLQKKVLGSNNFDLSNEETQKRVTDVSYFTRAMKSINNIVDSNSTEPISYMK